MCEHLGMKQQMQCLKATRYNCNTPHPSEQRWPAVSWSFEETQGKTERKRYLYPASEGWHSPRGHPARECALPASSAPHTSESMHIWFSPSVRGGAVASEALQLGGRLVGRFCVWGDLAPMHREFYATCSVFLPGVRVGCVAGEALQLETRLVSAFSLTPGPMHTNI